MAFTDGMTIQQILEHRAERHRMSLLSTDETLDYLEAQVNCLSEGGVWTPAQAEETFTNVRATHRAEKQALLTVAEIEAAVKSFQHNYSFYGQVALPHAPVGLLDLAGMLSDPAPEIGAQMEPKDASVEPTRYSPVAPEPELALGGSRRIDLD